MVGFGGFTAPPMVLPGTAMNLHEDNAVQGKHTQEETAGHGTAMYIVTTVVNRITSGSTADTRAQCSATSAENLGTKPSSVARIRAKTARNSAKKGRRMMKTPTLPGKSPTFLTALLF